MSVHQLKDGRWFCAIPAGTIPGQDKQKKEYFGRGPEGEAKARARHRELGIGVPVARHITSVSFGELAEKYLESKDSTATRSTLNSLLYKVNHILIPLLGDLMAHEVTHAALDKFMAARSAQGVKNRTIRDDLAYIKAILNFGVGKKLIASSSAHGYKPPRNDQSKIKPPNRAED